jgi:hypothetical protein
MATAKADPQRAYAERGPVRTESGTRVVAVRLTPETPASAREPRPSVSDVGQMPTRELDVAELRRMALRCASDVDAVGGAPAAALDAEPARDLIEAPPLARTPARLELVYADDDDEVDAVARAMRPPRVGRVVLAVLLVAAAIALALWMYASSSL